MNKIMVGLVFGAVLGAIDGATAWFTPAVRSIVTILLGSTFKGLLVGVLSGWYARKVQSDYEGDRAGFRDWSAACLPGGSHGR